ncbi:pilin [Patescibacteria group bacterium]|nr:pilin [Patescibacteria group bacterium]
MMVDLDLLNGTSFENLQDFLYFVINYAITISAVVAVVSLILSGFRYMLSFGDDKKIKAATSSLIYSLVGLVLVFIAPTVIKFVINTILAA